MSDERSRLSDSVICDSSIDCFKNRLDLHTMTKELVYMMKELPGVYKQPFCSFPLSSVRVFFLMWTTELLVTCSTFTTLTAGHVRLCKILSRFWEQYLPWQERWTANVVSGQCDGWKTGIDYRHKPVPMDHTSTMQPWHTLQMANCSHPNYPVLY